MNKNQSKDILYDMVGVLCVNVHIPEGVEEVVFGDDDLQQRPMKYVDIKYRKKDVYPNVKRIRIKQSIRQIDIPNKMFPNVREIISENTKYLSGTMLMYYKDNFSEGRDVVLKNTFCLNVDEVIDMRGVTKIENNAFVGCRSVNIINTANVRSIGEDAFNGSCFNSEHVKPIDGLIMAGTIIVAADENCFHYVIPESATASSVKLHFNKEGELIVRNSELLFNRCLGLPYNGTMMWFPKKVMIEDQFDVDACGIVHLVNSCFDVDLGIHSKDSKYSIIDGVVYDNDECTAIRCLRNTTGDIVIPEWVKCIADDAFHNRKISSVVIPASVKTIGDWAFSGCKNLESVVINESVEYIGLNCFSECTNLSRIEIPSTVKCIQKGTFEYCTGLSEVVLREGLEVISSFTFNGCSINFMEIPKSVKKLSVLSLRGIKHIKFKTEKLAGNSIYAIVASGTSSGNCEPIRVDTSDDTFYLPSYMKEKDISNIAFMLDDIIISQDWISCNDALNHLYECATNATAKQVLAFYDYQKCKSEKSRKYLSRSVKNLVSYFVKENQEENLSALLASGILSKNAMKNIYELIPDSMINARSYALNTINANSKKRTAFFL